jgi:O-antigen/teichoic acid export membrane protein
MSIVVAIVVTISGEFIINLFFGVEYRASANILVVHIWAAVFIFMRALFSRWILLEDALIFSLLTQAVGAVANIVLNY